MRHWFKVSEDAHLQVLNDGYDWDDAEPLSVRLHYPAYPVIDVKGDISIANPSFEPNAAVLMLVNTGSEAVLLELALLKLKSLCLPWPVGGDWSFYLRAAVLPGNRRIEAVGFNDRIHMSCTGLFYRVSGVDQDTDVSTCMATPSELEGLAAGFLVE